MAESFIINLLEIKSKNMTKLEKLRNSRMRIIKDHYQLIEVNLNKQKELDADPRATQQIEFHGMLDTKSQGCTILEKLKETVLEFKKGTAKVNI